jgi:hypothetical protein
MTFNAVIFSMANDTCFFVHARHVFVCHDKVCTVTDRAQIEFIGMTAHTFHRSTLIIVTLSAVFHRAQVTGILGLGLFDALMTGQAFHAFGLDMKFMAKQYLSWRILKRLNRLFVLEMTEGAVVFAFNVVTVGALRLTGQKVIAREDALICFNVTVGTRGFHFLDMELVGMLDDF